MTANDSAAETDLARTPHGEAASDAIAERIAIAEASDERFRALWTKSRAACMPDKQKQRDWDLALCRHALSTGWPEHAADQLLRRYRERHAARDVDDRYFRRTLGKARARPGITSEDDRAGLLEGVATDTTNGEEFARRYHDRLRFVIAWRRWIAWDGKRWRYPADHSAMAATKPVARDAGLEFERIDRRRAILGAAAAEQSLWVEHDALDTKELLLNLPNGTLDLETLRLREHRPSDLITQVTAVAFVAMATCPIFEAFLERVLPDPEVRAFLQRVLGYCLSGLVCEDVFFIAWGAGANGKGTLLQLVLKILGDYAGSAAAGLLMSKQGEVHPTNRATLFRKRLILCSETGEGKQLDEELVKELTGRDRISTRRMREDFWEFDPTHKLFLQTNYRPRIKGRDEGIWRRPQLIPFEVIIPEAQRDKGLPNRLWSEAAGVLAWAVRGWEAYKREGLNPPAVVREAMLRYRAMGDVVGAFLQARVERIADARIQAGQLHEAFKAWAEARGVVPLGLRQLGEQLVQLGFLRKESGGRSWWLNCRLRAAEEAGS